MAYKPTNITGGTPIAGWFIIEIPHIKWMMNPNYIYIYIPLFVSLDDLGVALF